MGLLYKGTLDHMVLEGLFGELGYRPKPGDAIDDREGVTLAAGMAIGLVSLGLGSSAFSGSSVTNASSILDATAGDYTGRLLAYANGTVRADQANGDMANGRSGDSASPRNASEAPGADSETSRIKESATPTIDVVSPGALLALAMVYLKTNDERLAERIFLPDNLYALNRVKPPHLYLRVLSRSLTMWDSIEPTTDWVLPSLPLIFRKPKDFDPLVTPSDLYYTGATSHNQDVDKEGSIQAKSFAITGACTAVGLRYAGTHNPRAVTTLLNVYDAFNACWFKLEAGDISLSLAVLTGLCSIVLAITIAARGSGRLDILKMLRFLRKRCDTSLTRIRYGIHMAIELLIPGGGCRTLGTNNTGIAGSIVTVIRTAPATSATTPFTGI